MPFLFFSFPPPRPTSLSLSVSHLKSVTQKNINIEFQIWVQWYFLKDWNMDL